MTDLHEAPARARHKAPVPEEPPDYRQPPQDMSAEQAVLGGMLLSKDAIADVLAKLGPDDFYRPAHGIVYDTILWG